MTKHFLPLTLTTTLLLGFFTPPPALAQFHLPDQTYQRPIVTNKQRVAVNECYQVVRQDFSVITYCKPDQFYLYLNNGQIIQVEEMQYNRNKIGQSLTR